MKYHNLVYCKHHSDDRWAYLYELPMDKEAHPGDRLCVEDRRGSHTVTAFCENFLLCDTVTEVICLANGGYFPPAQVAGEVKTITVTQDYINRYDKEEQLWF